MIKHTVYAPAIVLTAVSSLALTVASHAAVLAEYKFDNSIDDTTDDPDWASTDSDLNSTATDLSIGSGIGLNPDPVGGAIDGSGAVLRNSDTGKNQPFEDYSLYVSGATAQEATEADAITAENFLELTLTPNSGYETTLTSLTVQASSNNNNDYPDMYFVTVGGTQIGATESNPSPGSKVYEQITFDLSSVATTSGPLDIKFYIFSGGNSTSRNAQFDNFTLNGTVSVIPEPASLALMGLGGLLMLGRGRRAA